MPPHAPARIVSAKIVISVRWNSRVRTALIGSVSSTWHALRGLIRGGAEIACVLGLDEQHAPGVSDYRSLRATALDAGLPFQSFSKVSEPAFSAFLRQHRPDLLMVIGLSQLIPEVVVAIAPHGGVGFHPTPLPVGRGRAPVAWTILLEQPAAANLFYLVGDADAGDIIAQRAVEVRADDYAQDLIDRTNEVLEAMVVELGPALRSGRLPRTPQDHARATWYARRGPDDGLIDWSRSATDIYRLIRAVSRPYPGAFTSNAGETLYVWRARPHDRNDHHGTLGQIVRIDPSGGALVQTGDGLLWLTEVSAECGAAIPPEKLRVGARLGALPGAVDALQRQVALQAREIASLRAEIRRLSEGGKS